MGKIIRILIAIIVVLSFVLLARDNAAWAANPEADSSPNAEQSIAPDGRRHCDNNHKDGSDDCEDDRGERDDEDDEDEDDDDGDGTVKPPRHRGKLCKVGVFSVGGQATIQVERLDRGACVSAFIEPYNSHSYPQLPKGTRVLSDVLSVKLPKKNAAVKICFAVPPGNGASIYTISRRVWQSVGSVRNGVACTETSRSGTYILLR